MILRKIPNKSFSFTTDHVQITGYIGPLNRYQTTNLDSSKLKKFVDNFESDENGRKLSMWVENTEGKEEIARYEQFLLFPQCFQKTCTADK